MTLFYNQNYSEVYFNIHEVLSNRSFEKTYPLIKQQWLLKEAYFNFLIKVGKVNPADFTDKKLRRFSLGRFLNQIDLLSKDKAGMNIPVLIIEILFLMLDKKHDRVMLRLDALKQYTYRYLKGKHRAKYFIKMISKLPDMDYNPEKTAKKVLKYKEQLLAHPMEPTEQETQIEIIPYEELWDITLGMLEDRSLLDAK